MKEKNNIKIISIGVVLLTQIVQATETSKSVLLVPKFAVAFEIIVCSLILYLFLMGVKNCLSRTFKNYKNIAYHNGNSGYNINSKENLTFDYETAKRVKTLMETKKKNEFKKNSTINEHLKQKEKV